MVRQIPFLFLYPSNPDNMRGTSSRQGGYYRFVNSSSIICCSFIRILQNRFQRLYLILQTRQTAILMAPTANTYRTTLQRWKTRDGLFSPHKLYTYSNEPSVRFIVQDTSPSSSLAILITTLHMCFILARWNHRSHFSRTVLWRVISEVESRTFPPSMAEAHAKLAFRLTGDRAS